MNVLQHVNMPSSDRARYSTLSSACTSSMHMRVAGEACHLKACVAVLHHSWGSRSKLQGKAAGTHHRKYMQEDADKMISHLASLADKRLIIRQASATGFFCHGMQYQWCMWLASRQTYRPKHSLLLG